MALPLRVLAALVPILSFVSAARATNSSLYSLCTTSYVAGLVANFGDIGTVTHDTSSISTTINTNYISTPSSGGPMWPTTPGNSFCNVTLSMSHVNLGDEVGHSMCT